MAGREAAGDALIQIGIRGGGDGMWGIRVSPGGDKEEGAGCGWAGLAARWPAGRGGGGGGGAGAAGGRGGRPPPRGGGGLSLILFLLVFLSLFCFNIVSYYFSFSKIYT